MRLSESAAHPFSGNRMPTPEPPLEIAIVGDLTDHEAELTDRLLDVPPGGECILYFDSPGGSPYCALALMNLIRLRGLRATGVVTGECSSAAIWPWAVCQRRLVTPLSVLLFHPMKWQSEEHVGLAEAAEWARHFAFLEREMDVLLAEVFGAKLDTVLSWMQPGKYVIGREIVEAGLAEMIDPSKAMMPPAERERSTARRKKKKAKRS
jgi:ATP-dependent protease ClpP protease subunit